MAEPNEYEFDAFSEEVEYLVKVLQESFESTDAKHFIDEHNDVLYIKLEGLNDYSEDEIEEIATPILEIIDLDFEEIILLPL